MLLDQLLREFVVILCLHGLVEWGGETGYYLANTPSYTYSDSDEDGPEIDRQLQIKDITVLGDMERLEGLWRAYGIVWHCDGVI